MGPVHTLTILLVTIASVVEGVFYLQPESADVIVGRLVELECGTLEKANLIFTYDSPPGTSVNIDSSSSEAPASGGTKIVASFVVTAELNMTNVTCHVIGTNLRTPSATVRAQYMPEVREETVRTCQLGTYVFFHWPHVFVLDRIIARYRIVDNFNMNITVDEPHYWLYSLSDQTKYEAHITVELNETVTGYIVNGSDTRFTRTLGARQLTPVLVDVYKGNDNYVGFNLSIQLPDDAHKNCFFDTNLEPSAKLRSCNGNCTDFDATIKYKDGKLFSTSKVDLSQRHRFISNIRFSYAGQEIETDNITTSTYDIQDVDVTPNCLNIALIKNFSISTIYLQFKLKEEIEENFEKNVLKELLVQPVCFLTNQNNDVLSFVQGGNWTLQVYEDSIQNVPAYELRNVTIDRTRSSSGTSTAISAVPLVMLVMLLAIITF